RRDCEDDLAIVASARRGDGNREHGPRPRLEADPTDDSAAGARDHRLRGEEQARITRELDGEPSRTASPPKPGHRLPRPRIVGIETVDPDRGDEGGMDAPERNPPALVPSERHTVRLEGRVGDEETVEDGRTGGPRHGSRSPVGVYLRVRLPSRRPVSDVV